MSTDQPTARVAVITGASSGRESVVAAADRVRHDLGGADILVNNAGAMLTAPFSSNQREEHRRMVETNLLGAMAATEVFLDQLRDRGACCDEERVGSGTRGQSAASCGSDQDGLRSAE